MGSEAVEILMIADAIPKPTIGQLNAHCPIALGDPDRPFPWSLRNRLKEEAGMSSIRTPELICLVCSPFDVGRQGIV